MPNSIELPYGNSYLKAYLPDDVQFGVYRPQSVSACPDPAQEIQRALQEPLGSLPLEQIIKSGEKVVILVDDHTRSTPAALILPFVLQTCHQVGITDKDITIMITHGTHRLSTVEEVRQKVGEEVMKRYRVEQHRCNDEQNQVFLGLTSRGTPVWINRLVVEADRRIGIGHVGPSPYAGYSGGYKLIVPGVAALDTINANHSMVPVGFRKAGAIDLPTRLDIEEAAKLIGMDFLIDVVLDQQDCIIKAFTGEPQTVFLQAVELARRVFEVDCPKPIDIALSSAYPYDLDLYQAVRAVEYADAVVRDGGSIVLIAQCPDGWGGEDFHRLMTDRTKRAEDYLRDVTRRNGLVTFSVLGYALARIKSEKNLYLVSEAFSASELAAAGFNRVGNLQQTLEHLLVKYTHQARLAVFPIGSATVAH